MIVEHNNSNWSIYVQHIVVGQCFYYGDSLYLRIQFDEKSMDDKVVAVALEINALRVFPYDIKVTPVRAKVVVDGMDSQSDKPKLVKFDGNT